MLLLPMEKYGTKSLDSMGNDTPLAIVGTPNPTWVGVECEKSQWSPSDLGI